MSNENKKEIKVKMRVVAFSDLPKMKEISFREVGVGNMKAHIQKENKDKNVLATEIDKEELEREGNESIF